MDFKTILQEKIKNITIKLNEDSIPGGVSDNKTPEAIAKKHGVSVEAVKAEIELGMKTEKEHTGNDKKKREIATDHVWEHPKYYSDKKHGLNASEKKLDETVTPQQMDAQNKKVVQTSVTAANEKAKKAKMDADAATAQAKSIQSSQASAKPTVGTLGEDGAADKAVEPPKEELTNTGVTPEQETKIKEFLTTNQGLDDTKFHTFVQSMGIDPHEAEELVYKIVYDLGKIILGASEKVETTPAPEIAPEEPVTTDETPVPQTMNEKVSRFSKSKMDVLKEAWLKVK